jgi:hypothetical protein
MPQIKNSLSFVGFIIALLWLGYIANNLYQPKQDIAQTNFTESCYCSFAAFELSPKGESSNE